MYICKRTCHFLLPAYGLLLMFGTWFPLSDWDWSAGGISAFMTMDIFEHLSRGDVLINLLIYIPLGCLAVQLPARITAGRLVFITLLGGLFSTGLEFGQTYLPGRFTSLSDILLNTTGTLLGAVAAAAVQYCFCRRSYTIPGPQGVKSGT